MLLVQTFANDLRAQQGWEAFGWSASGCAGAVYASTKADDGSYYLAGQFAACGDAEAHNVVRWVPADNRFESLSDGATNGVTGSLRALAVTAEAIYVGGITSTNLPGQSVLARYDLIAKQWSSIGSITGGSFGVATLYVHGPYLYVGGDFSHADGNSVDGLARYHLANQTWLPLGVSPARVVTDIVSIGNMVYIGGRMAEVDGAEVNNVAAYDPDTGTWEALPAAGPNGVSGLAGSPGIVLALSVSQGLLFVGGDFDSAGGDPAVDLARYDPVAGQWASVETTPTIESTQVVDLSGDSALIHALVETNLPNGRRGVQLASYSLQTADWTVEPDVLSFVGGTVHSDDSHLMVSGRSTLPGLQLNGIGIRSLPGGAWQALGSGIARSSNGGVGGFAKVGRKLVAVGGFTQIGGVAASQIAELDCDSGQWSPLRPSPDGIQTDGFFRSVVANESDIYVSGVFSVLNGIPINSVARYHRPTGQWSALGDGPDNGVAGLIFGMRLSDDALYVSGQFSSAGGQPVANLARYSLVDQTWSALGPMGSNGVDGAAYAIALGEAGLYAGGFFQTAGSVPAANIALYNSASQSWQSLGQGTSPTIYALDIHGNMLYAGGDFHQAGGMAAEGLAVYDLSKDQWHPIATSPDTYDFYFRLLASDRGVYLGGHFREINGMTANSIVEYRADEQRFLALDGGLTISSEDRAQPGDMAICSGRLWVGGYFTAADGELSNGIAAYRLDSLLEEGFE